MANPHGKYVAPKIDLVRFNCPHCSAFAAQTWKELGAAPLLKGIGGLQPTSFLPTTPNIVREYVPAPEPMDDPLKYLRSRESNQLRKALSGGQVVFSEWDSKATIRRAGNLFLSVCSSCTESAVWLYDRLLWPPANEAPPPNSDFSADVRRDYEEASRILELSPRGAAALLRLAIQKLCKELGGTGKDLDKDIGMLVTKGLPVKVQQALDIVRVIGNEAVHPGVLDLRDDRATASTLFGLVNMIADRMITQPKEVAVLFDGLPQTKRDAIERRDGKKPDP